jgi:hypothetical protein
MIFFFSKNIVTNTIWKSLYTSSDAVLCRLRTFLVDDPNQRELSVDVGHWVRTKLERVTWLHTYYK